MTEKRDPAGALRRLRERIGPGGYGDPAEYVAEMRGETGEPMTEAQLQTIESGLLDPTHVGTHWEGCETSHPRCAVRVLLAEVRRLRAESSEMLSEDEMRDLISRAGAKS